MEFSFHLKTPRHPSCLNSGVSPKPFNMHPLTLLSMTVADTDVHTARQHTLLQTVNSYPLWASGASVVRVSMSISGIEFALG